jgi:hypothetical protein
MQKKEQFLEEKIYNFLDALRNNGNINMFESPEIVKNMYRIKKETARKIVANWMKRRDH